MSKETVPGPQWIRGWVGPKSGVDVRERKILPLPVIEN
jgi:hypothetical protein